MAATFTLERDRQGVTSCGPGASHRMRWLGSVRGPRRDGLDCEQPVWWMCRDCDDREQRRCGAYRESCCRPCAARYRRRVRAVAESGVGRPDGFQYLLTVTAPGDRAHRQRDGSWCPCTPVGGVDLAVWNASHSGRWNHLRTSLRRDYPGVEYFRGVEVQGRGALHDHAMVWSPVPLRLRDVRARAMAAGFGHSVDLAPAPAGSRRAAYYVAKYVTKATDSRADVPWLREVVDVATGEVTGLRPGRYRTWSMSRGWGDSMATVRARAAAYASARAVELGDLVVAAVVAALGGVVLAEPPQADSASP